MNGADDQQLLQSAALGDRDAFGHFVRRHQAAVLRLLTSISDSHDAEDALQEAFVAAWRGAAGYAGGPSARGWIMTIARNALRRVHRRRAGEPASHETLAVLGAEAGWGQEQPDALEGLIRREFLERALAGLGAEDREILVLRELEGFSGDEVAGMLGLSLPAMKSRLHRARLRFVATLQEVGND